MACRQRIVNDNATLLLNLRDKWTRRDEVFNARKKLKCKLTKDLPSVQIQSESSSVIHNAAIHITESLIPYRKHLFSRILDFKKNHHFKYLWTSNGKIVLRESDSSTRHSFVSLEQFDEYQDSLSHNRLWLTMKKSY